MTGALARGLSRVLARRSRRERRLLALLVLVAIPLGLGFGVVQPLHDRGLAARAALAEARADQAWYRDRLPAIAALPGPELAPDPGGAAPAAVGLGGIEARLIEAGLRDFVTQLSAAAGNAVTLTLAEVPFVDLMHWIDGVEAGGTAGAGYRLVALRMVAGDAAGQVQAEMRFEPATGLRP